MADLGVVSAGVAVMAAVATLSNDRAQAQASATATRVPVFEVDPAWPKLPNDWVVGHVASVAVDRRDHVWMLHRPNTIPEDRRSHAAPPVLEFDACGEIRERVGRPRVGLRLAGQRTRHRRRLQGPCVDRRQRAGRAVASERSTTTCSSSSTTRGSSCCKSAGEASARATPTRRPCTSRRTSSCGPRPTRHSSRTATGTAASIVFDADTGAFKRSGAHSATRPSMCRPQREEVAQEAQAARTPAAAVAPRRLSIPRARVTAVRRAGARRQGLERRAGLRGRPSEPQSAGLHAGREVRDADIHQSIRAVTAVGGRTGVLPRRAAAIPLCRRLRQLAHRGARSKEPAAPLPVRAAQREAGRLPGPASPGDRFQRATSTPARSRRARARSDSCSKDCRTRCRPTRSRRPWRRLRALGRARFRHRVRRAAAIRRGPARWRARTA